MMRLPFIACVVLAACGSDDGAAPMMLDPNVELAIPVDSRELFSYLQARTYETAEGWEAEPAPHASVGPHGQVRTYFDPTLLASLRSNGTSHPAGAATIKELYSGDSVSGWAVMVKTADGTSGDDWYWYEVFSTTDNNPVVDANGAAGCTGCHSQGVDFVRASAP